MSGLNHIRLILQDPPENTLYILRAEDTSIVSN